MIPPLRLARRLERLPCAGLSAERRAELGAAPQDTVLTLRRGRVGSRVVGPEVVALLDCFADTTPVAEALHAFGRARSLPREVLLQAGLDLVLRFRDEGFLVEEGDEPEGPTPGDRVYGFEIVRSLQEAGASGVYEALDDHGRRVALKIGRGDLHTVREIRREAALTRRAPGFPAVVAAGGDDDGAWMALEWLPGRPLGEVAHEHRQGGQRRALLTLVGGVARAYADLHAAGVLHGDVHAGNVLIDGGRVRLVDLGLGTAPRDADAVLRSARRGAAPGTYDPEFAAALLSETPAPAVTPASEQHCIARLLFQVMTGDSPWEVSVHPEATRRAVLETPPAGLEDRGVRWLPKLSEVLRRALSADPDDRFASTGAFADAVVAALPAAPVRVRDDELNDTLRRLVDAELGGIVFEPAGSLADGRLGAALFLQRMAALREDPELLAAAERHLHWARMRTADPAAWGIGGRDVAGSVLHGPTGGSWSAAVVHDTQGSDAGRDGAAAGFASTLDPSAPVDDAWLGRPGHLTACAVLRTRSRAPALRRAGDALLAEATARFARLDPGREGPRYLGAAHGWAGILHGIFAWCAADGVPAPAWAFEALDRLTGLAEPRHGGLVWAPARGMTAGPLAASLCNGAAGFIALYGAAFDASGDDRLLDPAVGAARALCAAPPRGTTLCCGTAGAAYALAGLSRRRDEVRWRRAATALLEPTPPSADGTPSDWGLFSGRLGSLLARAELSADVRAPGLPFLEPEGGDFSGR